MFQQRDFNFIYKYFIAEKQESLLFLIIGIVAILLSIVCWFFIKGNPGFFKGAAIPLVVIGLAQITVGYTVYSRTDKQTAEVAYNMGMEPTNYTANTELPRMKKVMKSFVIYRWTEITCILLGLVLFIVFRTNPEKSFWCGLGLALVLQATLMLGADYFAEQRGTVYLGELEKLIQS